MGVRLLQPINLCLDYGCVVCILYVPYIGMYGIRVYTCVYMVYMIFDVHTLKQVISGIYTFEG